MSTWQAVRNNPAAICWSLVISTCVIMEGYDTALLGNFWAYPSSQKNLVTLSASQRRPKAATRFLRSGRLVLVRLQVSAPFLALS
jgi:hypothetical protein